MNVVKIDGGDDRILVIEDTSVSCAALLSLRVEYNDPDPEIAFLSREDVLELYSALEEWLLETAFNS